MADVMQARAEDAPLLTRERTKGYGLIPKQVMQDRRLSVEAKAIYAYFCSYAGAGETAFPGVEKILYDLGIGRTRYYKHLDSLKELGYLQVKQEHGDKSQFLRNIYTLTDDAPRIRFGDTGHGNTDHGDTGHAHTGHEDNISNRLKSNSLINNKPTTNREREPRAQCETFGEFGKVELTAAEREQLVTRYGEGMTAEYITRLDQHIVSKGIKYRNHYATLLKWLAEDTGKKRADKPEKDAASPVRRRYDMNALERMDFELMKRGQPREDPTDTPAASGG